MPVTPDDFLASAKEILTNNEMAVRNAISRTYYYAYLHCIKSVGYINTTGQDRGVHSVLSDYLTKRGSSDTDKIYKKIGYILINAKSFRTKADYFLDATLTEADAEQVFLFAKKITDLLVELKTVKSA